MLIVLKYKLSMNLFPFILNPPSPSLPFGRQRKAMKLCQSFMNNTSFCPQFRTLGNRTK